jgi:hypothetical protein
MEKGGEERHGEREQRKERREQKKREPNHNLR